MTLVRLLLLAIFANVAYASGNIHDVWSGEFFATTKDDVEVGIVGSIPSDISDCYKQTTQTVFTGITHQEFLASEREVFNFIDMSVKHDCARTNH